MENAKNKLEMTLTSDTDFLLTRVLNAPRELVYKVYTDPQSVPQWWGPAAVTTIVDQMDVRPGGQWRYIQRDADGNEYAFRGEYREVTPPERLVHTFEFEPMPGVVGLVTTTFEDLGTQTRIVETNSFPDKASRDGIIESGMEEGAAELYDRLEALVMSML